VMEGLWEKECMTGREATELLEERMGWNRSTTLTLLRRMEEKGQSAVRQRVRKKCFVRSYREKMRRYRKQKIF